jgi:hypothetical protein
MPFRHLLLCLAALLNTIVIFSFDCRAQADGVLPAGVKPVWDLSRAYREATSTRERICINGLWRWQPADPMSAQIPQDGWGYFKVPGAWPGITDYMQKDCQTVHPHPRWKNHRFGSVTAAWYQREITVPQDWHNRRIKLALEYLNSFATVFIDGREVGDIHFPAGEVDLTSMCRPGGRHVISLIVVAMPLKAVMLSFNDTNAARKVRGKVKRRGLCGDVYLCSVPSGPRIGDLKIDTSVRKGELRTRARLHGLEPGASYRCRITVTDLDGREVAAYKTAPFNGRGRDGSFESTWVWMPERLWDVHTPGNMYWMQYALLDANGVVLDAYRPVRFGFREFWIEGRDFYLNGTRIYLSAVPLDNAQVGAAWATYARARESMLRLKSIGINFVYTHNYGCQPGSHLGFGEILRAADDVGMLVSFSQPHFGHYSWEAKNSRNNNGYKQHAAFYVRMAQNHPAVVCYATSHNSTGDAEDMNPDLMGRPYEVSSSWVRNNRERALQAEAIIQSLDPSRVIYHHSSGSFGDVHTSNFYPNWVPVQEMSDWFEMWAKHGTKPVFTCEYAAPFTWDWGMYRGWYQGKRRFGGAKVPWEFCLAEWNAQFYGDRAYRISEMEKRNLRWEAMRAASGERWHRWDYPHSLGSREFDERDPIIAEYIRDNWRAFRTWGLSANSPWEHRVLFRLHPNAPRNIRRELETDWGNLQRPGFSPDFLQDRYERRDLAYGKADWVATRSADALVRNNRPLLAYIGGGVPAFTRKAHNYLPGETVEKQLIVINNSRETVSGECRWKFASVQAGKHISVPTGRQIRLPISIRLPENIKPGAYDLSAAVAFSTGETQTDVFTVHVLPAPSAVKSAAKVAVFDPKGETTGKLRALGLTSRAVSADADLSAYDMLIIGKEALTVGGPGPDISGVRDGLKVIVFEQVPEVLEKRFGFRTAAYGLRKVFKRVPDHPLLAGLGPEHLANWRGEATIVPPRLEPTGSREKDLGHIFTWCGLPVTRLHRCGNRGSVATALIEKPACGDFLPIVDGGFSLQYSPLMEYREGDGMVLFCQMDVTGRTAPDPAADRLVRNLLAYVAAWKTGTRRTVVYAGDANGMRHLRSTGLAVEAYDGRDLPRNRVLVVGPGGSRELMDKVRNVNDWVADGGSLLAVGLDAQEANALFSNRVRMRRKEHIAAYFEPAGAGALMAGIGPADVHSREPRKIPLVVGGARARTVGDGVLASLEGVNVVFCQMVPWDLRYRTPQYGKRTFRRASCLVMRLLGNMGAGADTPLLARFAKPVRPWEIRGRWLQGLYLDNPEAWDHPYRFFRW